MKKCKGIIVVVVVMLFLTACEEKSDDSSNTQEKKTEIATDSTTEMAANSTMEMAATTTEEVATEETFMPATREYFENVNKDYTLEDIKKEIGPYFKKSGFGEIYFDWKLEDGTEAHIHFSDVDEKIDRIHIIHSDNTNEMIYCKYQKKDD